MKKTYDGLKKRKKERKKEAYIVHTLFPKPRNVFFNDEKNEEQSRSFTTHSRICLSVNTND